MVEKKKKKSNGKKSIQDNNIQEDIMEETSSDEEKESKNDTKKHYKSLMKVGDISNLIKELCIDKKKFVIWIAQIDPDAIGSAMIVRYYLSVCLSIDPSYISIYYAGAISHAQNRCIFNLFELDNLFQRIDSKDIEAIKEENEVWVLVDSNSLKDTRFKGVDLSEIDIVIDHHRLSPKDRKDDKIYYIDSIGAASTLATELLEAECISFDELPSDAEREKVLTLASIGIRSDTNNFTSPLTHTRDSEALNKLIPFINNDLTTQVENYPLDNNYFNILSTVLETRKVKGVRAVASAGYIYEDDGDQLAEACNLLIRESRVSIAVVWGIILEKGTVRLSIRSKDVSLNLDTKLKEIFGKGGAKQSKGTGEGGVLLDMGDFVPIGGLKEDENYKRLWKEIIEANIENRIAMMLKDNSDD